MTPKDNNTNPPVRSFRRDEKGGVSLFLALSMTLLVLIVGVGVSMGRSQMVQTRMQASMDSAALAAAVAPDGVSDDDRRMIGQRYFFANFPDGYGGGDFSASQLEVNVEPTRVTAGGEGTVRTDFVNVAGPDRVGVGGFTEVRRPDPAEEGIADVVLVLDTTSGLAAGVCAIPNGTFTNYMGCMQDGIARFTNALMEGFGCTTYGAGCPPAKANLVSIGIVGWKKKWHALKLTTGAERADNFRDAKVSCRSACDHYECGTGYYNFIYNDITTEAEGGCDDSSDYSTGYVGVNKAAQMLRGSTKPAKIMILIQDGESNDDSGGEGGYDTFAAACDAFKNTDKGIIYALQFGNPAEMNPPPRTDVLRACASGEGEEKNKYFFPPTSDGYQLRANLDTIRRDLLTLNSDNGNSDNKLRIVD